MDVWVVEIGKHNNIRLHAIISKKVSVRHIKREMGKYATEEAGTWGSHDDIHCLWTGKMYIHIRSEVVEEYFLNRTNSLDRLKIE